MDTDASVKHDLLNKNLVPSMRIIFLHVIHQGGSRVPQNNTSYSQCSWLSNTTKCKALMKTSHTLATGHRKAKLELTRANIQLASFHTARGTMLAAEGKDSSGLTQCKRLCTLQYGPSRQDVFMGNTGMRLSGVSKHFLI